MNTYLLACRNQIGLWNESAKSTCWSTNHSRMLPSAKQYGQYLLIAWNEQRFGLLSSGMSPWIPVLVCIRDNWLVTRWFRSQPAILLVSWLWNMNPEAWQEHKKMHIENLIVVWMQSDKNRNPNYTDLQPHDNKHEAKLMTYRKIWQQHLHCK